MSFQEKKGECILSNRMKCLMSATNQTCTGLISHCFFKGLHCFIEERLNHDQIQRDIDSCRRTQYHFRRMSREYPLRRSFHLGVTHIKSIDLDPRRNGAYCLRKEVNFEQQEENARFRYFSSKGSILRVLAEAGIPVSLKLLRGCHSRLSHVKSGQCK